MEIEDLVEAYAKESFDNMAIPKLYQSMDATDIKSNAYDFRVNDEDDSDTVTMYTIHFDKYAGAILPAVKDTFQERVETVNIEEGMEPPVIHPEEFGPFIEESLYKNFTENVDTATYFGEGFDGVKNAIKTFKQSRNFPVSTVVTSKDYLDSTEKDGLSEMFDVEIVETDTVDSDELLLSNQSIGYFAVRSKPYARSYIDAHFDSGIDEPNIDNPLVVNFAARIATAEIYPSRGLRFVPISNN